MRMSFSLGGTDGPRMVPGFSSIMDLNLCQSARTFFLILVEIFNYNPQKELIHKQV